MANKIWIGAAQAVAQITTITFSAYTSGQTYTLTINGKSISYLAVASTSADVWGGLVNAWNASTIPEHVEAIASVSAGVRLTSRTAGTPFTATASATGGITSTVTPTQAATGPNDFMAAGNFTDNAVPVAGDTFTFRDSAVSVLYNIEQTGIDFSHLAFEASYTGNVGLPATNSGGYPEYRPRRLKLGGGTNSYNVVVGLGVGQGSPRILIDANNASVALTCYGTGNANVDSRPLQLFNTDSSSVLAIYGGVVLIGTTGTGAAASLSIIASQNSSIKPTVEVQAGVTITAATVQGGRCDNWGTLTTAIVAEQAEVYNYGAIPTVKVSAGGVVYWTGSSNLATKAHIYDKGVLDFSRNNAAKSVAAVDLYDGGKLADPLGVVTYTSGVILVGAKLADVTLDVGRSRTLTIA